MEQKSAIELYAESLAPIFDSDLCMPLSAIKGRGRTRLISDNRSLFIWAMIVYGGFTQREVAKYLGISNNSVFFHIKKIRNQINHPVFREAINSLKHKLETL